MLLFEAVVIGSDVSDVRTIERGPTSSSYLTNSANGMDVPSRRITRQQFLELLSLKIEGLQKDLSNRDYNSTLRDLKAQELQKLMARFARYQTNGFDPAAIDPRMLSGPIARSNLSRLSQAPIQRARVFEPVLPTRAYRTTNSLSINSNLLSLRDAILKDPNVITTNVPSFLQLSFMAQIESMERQLASTSLNPSMRQTLEAGLKHKRTLLALTTTNEQLWVNLRQARKSGSREDVARAEQELATFLTIRLNSIQGRSLPTNMALDSVLAEYRKFTGASDKANTSMKITRWLLGLAAFGPPVIAFLVWRARRMRHVDRMNQSSRMGT